MPSNAINPFNYNIDKFDSGFLGPINDNDFRKFLFTHNLPNINPVIGGIIGNQISDRGTEYNVSDSNPNVTDVPNLVDVANTPSLYNNLSNPREVNIKSNLQNVNPQVANTIGTTSLQQAGLGVDVANQISSNQSNIDLPSLENVSDNGSVYNNFTQPKQNNLERNPTLDELIDWYPEYQYVFTQNYQNSYKSSYGVPQTFRLGFAGNVESWVSDGNYVTTTSQIRDNIYFLQNNKWGPNDINQYDINNKVETITPNIGFREYNYVIQNDFRDQLLSRSLGVGMVPFSTVGSGINFLPDNQNISQLDEIARKQRGDELKNRIKLNFTDETVGALNISPFNLLGGGSLIQKDYTITVPKTLIGKAAQFAADLAGFTLPTSIIPDGSFGNYGVNKDSIDVTTDILDYTGGGQKSFLYNAFYINKYGPTLESQLEEKPTGFVKKVGKLLKNLADNVTGAGQAPNTVNYLNDPGITTPEKSKPGTLIDKINNAVDAVTNKKQNRPNAPDITQGALEVATNDRPGGGFYGKYEIQADVPMSDVIGLSEENQIDVLLDYDKADTRYVGTDLEKGLTTTQTGTIDERIDWRPRDSNPFRKGLLYYTQQIVNKSELYSIGGYIGYFDSAEGFGGNKEYKQDTDKHGHSTGTNGTNQSKRPSKGNTARNLQIKIGPNGTVSGLKGGEYYSRSWSSRRKYHTWDNLVRSDGSWWRSNKDTNNLMTLNWDTANGGTPTGIPKIAWDRDDIKNVIDQTEGLKRKVIPYMFSIENLAWKGAPQQIYLPECEKGPNEGRIMWFPPYDINFTDNTSVNWDTNTFIGRGENIYTYNHTERSGTLDFTLIVDHPAVLNQIRKDFVSKFEGSPTGQDDIYHSFFAGSDAGTIKELFSKYIPPAIQESNQQATAVPTESPKNVAAKTPNESPYNDLSVYFDNASTDDKCGSTTSKCTTLNITQDGRALNFNYEGQPFTCSATGSTRNGLNQGVQAKIDELCEFLVGKGKYEGQDDGKNYTINLYGYASPQSSGQYNLKLGWDRVNAVKTYMVNKMIALESGESVKLPGTNKNYPVELNLRATGFDNYLNSGDKSGRWGLYTKGEEGSQIYVDSAIAQNDANLSNTGADSSDCGLSPNDVNSIVSKSLRYVKISLEQNTKLQVELLEGIINEQKVPTIEKEKEEKRQQAEAVAQTFITECEYFEKLKRDQPFVYNSFAEKIKYFHPAFHSTTPEGFNSRLTFLQQCTRQGPQNLNSGQPSNMAFGRPPVCVLRIGDFYHTKIIVDNVNISYEPLQWDLNPEGIGVQPMLAKISMGFKFVGGSSLGGPISQLQNAVSYNFFANTGIYQPAKELINETGNKLKLIYGAFITPEQEQNFYNGKGLSLDSIQEKVNEENAALATNTNVQENKGATQDVIQKTAAETKSDTTTSTDENKAPTPADTTKLLVVKGVTEGNIETVKYEIKDEFKGKWKITEASYSKINLESICGNKSYIGEGGINGSVENELGVFLSDVNIASFQIKEYVDSRIDVDKNIVYCDEALLSDNPYSKFNFTTLVTITKLTEDGFETEETETQTDNIIYTIKY